jgi:hypothetical protein
VRDYGKVHTSFWSSATTRAMTEDARTLALYLITSPHSTIAGVFRLPDGYVCEDLQWSSERVAEGFQQLLSKGFANRCETTKWVWVAKHLEWNPPENPNQRKSALKVAQSVPDECSWKSEFMRVSGPLLGFEEPSKANPSPTVAEPFLNQEQEQEQEQKKAPPSRSVKAMGSRLPEDWTLPSEWQDWAETDRPDLEITSVACGFRDYWVAKPGKDGRKTDWQATWRNWVRNQRQQNGRPPAAPPAWAGAR